MFDCFYDILIIMSCSTFSVMPVIDCFPARASVGDTQFNLTCRIKARPEVISLYWTIKGLNVSDRQLNNEYYTSVRASEFTVFHKLC